MQPHVVFTQNAAGLGAQESEWIMCDSWCPGPVSVQVNVYNVAGGTPVTYTVASTLDDPNDNASPVPVTDVTWFACHNALMVSGTQNAQTYYASAPRYIKLMQSGGDGIAQMTVSQNGSICS